ncbi:MAG TPA: copper chaperone PCu(A)C [Streptosporangiaceae bacterium]|jgi:copper(I)-binding protein
MIGGVALLAPVLAGCEAGNGAPVLEFHPAANGAMGTADALTVSDAFILGGANGQAIPAGGSASMFLSVYNGGSAADKLVGVDTDGASKSVQLTGGSIPVPAQSMADLEGPQPKVVLRNLSKKLTAGTTVEVLLSFQNSGSVELTVPVEARSTYYSSFSPPAPAPTPSASKRVSVGATSPASVNASPNTGTGSSPSASASAP